MRAIGGAAVVDRLAHSYLEKRGAWVAAAARQIARKRYSYSHTASQKPPVGAPLACDRRRSRRRPGSAVFLKKRSILNIVAVR